MATIAMIFYLYCALVLVACVAAGWVLLQFLKLVGGFVCVGIGRLALFVVRSSTMLTQATAAVSIGLICPDMDLVCFFLAIIAVGVLQFHVGKFVLVVSELVSNISSFLVVRSSTMMLGNPVLHGVECPPASPPTSARPSVCWSSSGNRGYDYDKHAPASTRGTEFKNVPFRNPTPTPRPIPRQVLVIFPTKSDKECPPAPARSRSRKGPGPLPCPIQLDPTFLQHDYDKHAATVGVDDDDDDKSTHGDGDPVTVTVTVVEPPPLRRSARIAAKKSADIYNSCQVVLERPLPPPSARIAASGIRRSSRLAAKARVNYCQ